MSILTKASWKSRSRGYDYYIKNKVLSCKEISNIEYEGTVQGSAEEPYKVRINLEKTMSSSCNCPFANGRKICKHMVAVFFCVFPDEAQKYESEYKEYKSASKRYYYDDCFDGDYFCDDEPDDDYIDEEEFSDEFEDMLRKCINKLSKTQLQNALFDLLYDGTEEQLDMFLYHYVE
ncbi:MAG: SWIM zinc finger family protein [Clostridia bacterium]|nr:SWIM zinc finger family protein [Clostridia bacterium]MBQ4631006.1 SWIM zinc finger family protein [Clostridia bacterium]